MKALLRPPKMQIKKGDVVTVLTGSEKGKSGKVLQALPRTQRVLVEGLNLVKKHMRKSQDNPNGAIVEKEAPIHVSNVRVQKAGA